MGKVFVKAVIRHIVLLGSILALTGVAQTVKAEPVESDQTALEYQSIDSLFYLYQPYMTNISAYEPIYFLVGTEPEKSKFQISFKYRFFSRDGSLTQDHPWVQGIHFGYTQTSFWNLEDNSLPFEDTSYKPELFYISRNLVTSKSWLKGFFVQSGVLHESNGQAGDISRSTNYVYTLPILVLYNERNKLGLAVAPKLWAYFNNSTDNPDLPDYRGNFELNFIIGKADGMVLSSCWRLASEGGSAQIDISYPIGHYLSDNFNIYLNVQYVDALAESLLDYRERTKALRLGFSFVR
jgi:outer membrane phospholipase A